MLQVAHVPVVDPLGCETQLDCAHPVVDVDGFCGLCATMLPMCELYADHRHVVDDECECYPPTAYIFELEDRGDAVIEELHCDDCGELLSIKSVR